MSGPDKRLHERVPASGLAIRVKFNDVAHLEQYYLRDISRGGIFLRAKTLKALHEQLYVVLALPDGSEVKLRGEVVHVVAPEEASAQRPSGMGVQFLDLTPEVKQQLEEYVNRLKQRRTSVDALAGKLADLPPSEPAPEIPLPPPPSKPPISRAAQPVRRMQVPTPTKPIPARQPAAPEEFKKETSEVSGATYEEENDQALLRRLCWLLAEGSVMGRPIKEIFGVGSGVPAIVRSEVYDRLRKALAPERPPRHLGAEEARAISRLLAMLEAMTRED